MDTETMTDRALDALVAEKIFGGPQRNVQWYWWKNSTPPLAIDPPLYAGPHFSSDIAAAWQLIEHLAAQGVRWRLENLPLVHMPHGSVFCLFVIDDANATAIAVGTPRAISEAALAWVQWASKEQV